MAYTKQNFEDGKAVTAAQLNKMDAQIAANENAAAQAKAKAAEALSRYGGEMNGPLILASAPAEPMQAATKQYVDAVAAQGGGGTQPSVVAIEPAEDDIPKVFIDGTIPTTKDDVFAELTYVSKSETFHAFIKIKCQGSSSMSYPKKNFTVKLYSDEARETKMSKLFKDWDVESSKFVLKANYIDHSHARNIICARLWDEVVSSRPDYAYLPAEMRNSPRNGAVDGFPIKVYTNGTYQGVYTWNIGKDAWMWGMDEDNPNHVLMCGEKNTDGVYSENACNFRKLWSGTNGDDWSVEVGTNSDTVKNSLNALITCVMDTDDAAFKSTIGNYLDVQSAIDYYLHQYVICGIDNLAKNLLLATYDGKKWICGAYDMDSTFGITPQGSTSVVKAQYACPEKYQEQFSLLWERIESNFSEEIKARYTELRGSVYSFSNIVTKFERFMDVIGSDLYAEDATIYPVPSTETNNIKFIRDFARDRLVYTDNKILNPKNSGLIVSLQSSEIDASNLIWTDSANSIEFELAKGTPDINENGLLMTSCIGVAKSPISLDGAFTYDIEFYAQKPDSVEYFTFGCFFSFNQNNASKYCDNVSDGSIKLNGYSGNTQISKEAIAVSNNAMNRLVVVRGVSGDTVVFFNGEKKGTCNRGTFDANGEFDIVLGASSYGGYPNNTAYFRIKKLDIYEYALTDDEVYGLING